MEQDDELPVNVVDYPFVSYEDILNLTAFTSLLLHYEALVYEQIHLQNNPVEFSLN